MHPVNIDPVRWRLAERRLRSILSTYTVACSRTLEQKISDAGPYNQRINPHVLTPVRQAMVACGDVQQIRRGGADWYSLAEADHDLREERLQTLLPIHKALGAQRLTKRIGQALEIAIYRALLCQEHFSHTGAFVDLDDHDDSQNYIKEEPPASIGGLSIYPKRLDFILFDSSGNRAGIEAKNVREWMYPNRDEILEFLYKCVTLDCVPIFIARRYPYVTFKVLSQCGVIFHETYNQLFPLANDGMADLARAKHLLGYHDIREGNDPDKRLLTFFSDNLPKIFANAKASFEDHKDLLSGYATGAMPWLEFAARVRRRGAGAPEDFEYDPDLPPEYY